MAKKDSTSKSVDATTVTRLELEHRTEVGHAVVTLEGLRARKRHVEEQLVIIRSNIARLPQNETGWHRGLVWPVLLIGAIMEWNIAWLVAQTVFGQTQYGLYAFAVALAVCGVTAGWFLGRVLRKQRMAESEPSASLIRFVVVSIAVVVVLLIAAFLLRIQAARTVGDLDAVALIGQATITTVLSALGILVAAGFEFFRQGDDSVDASKARKSAEKERDTLDGHIFRAEAHYHRTVRAYRLVMAEVGAPTDEAFLDEMAARSEVTSTSSAPKTPAKATSEVQNEPTIQQPGVQSVPTVKGVIDGSGSSGAGITGSTTTTSGAASRDSAGRPAGPGPGGTSTDNATAGKAT